MGRRRGYLCILLLSSKAYEVAVWRPHGHRLQNSAEHQVRTRPLSDPNHVLRAEVVPNADLSESSTQGLVAHFLGLSFQAHGDIADSPGGSMSCFGHACRAQAARMVPTLLTYLSFFGGGPAGGLGGRGGLSLLFSARGNVGAGHGGDRVGADLGVAALGGHHGHD